MNFKNLNRAFAIMAFLLATVVYLMTVQSTVPFWDCGEFSAAAIWQQVPHPPGAPLFLIIGKIFHLIIPFGDPGWKVNLVAVFSSSVTILFLYLITVKVLTNLRGNAIKTTADAVAVFGSAFLGAAAFTFSDTFWFNAVESEVYATSTLFVAIIVYLMMRWHEEADNPGHERFLLLIAYLIGLSTGVHLLSILTIFSIALVVYFRKYEFTFTTFIFMGIIAVLIFWTIYPAIVKWLPAFLSGHSPWKNEAFDYTFDNDSARTAVGIFGLIATVIVFMVSQKKNSIELYALVGGMAILLIVGWIFNIMLSVMAIAVILGAVVGLIYGINQKKPILKLVTLSFLLMLLGYTTYTQILLRSNANPPMNENEPKNFTKLASYLGREQYGDAPMWPRRYQRDEYYTRHYDKYGTWYKPGRKPVTRKDGSRFSVPHFDKVNTSGELNYLFRYQISHMYVRYFAWNFIGRKSDVQDAGAYYPSFLPFVNNSDVDVWNYKSGYKDEFPVNFFMLPFILGVIGLLFHFSRDPKWAFVYLIMFLLMGVLTAIMQNQQEPQPRERDYFYAGSFMVFAMWIGIGAYSIIDWLSKKEAKLAIISLVLVGTFLLVPVNMAIGGWNIHDRSGNYIPFDYSYNILQSTEENAIIFTNGDNDTFPLWWLQDVAGVRRDVRVVNLSLGNTLWYVDQLKNRQPWGAEKIPLSFDDDSIQVDDENDPKALTYDFGEARRIKIPVEKEIISKYTDNQTLIDRGYMEFTFVGKPQQRMEDKMYYMIRVQDKLILDILREVRWKRPVYFSITVGPDAYCGLENHFRLEGMAYRVCPAPQMSGGGKSVDSEIMDKCLFNIDNTNNYHKEQHYGFKFRNLDNSDVYYDEVHRRLMYTYRHIFLSYAEFLTTQEVDKEKAIDVLDQMNKMISPVQFPMSSDLEHRLAKMYDKLGAEEKAKKYADMGIKSALEIIDDPKVTGASTGEEFAYIDQAGKHAAELYELKGDYQGARDVLQKVYMMYSDLKSQIQNNPQYASEINTVEEYMFRIMATIDSYKILELRENGKYDEALDTAKAIFDRYIQSNDPRLRGFAQNFMPVIAELERSTQSEGEEIEEETKKEENSYNKENTLIKKKTDKNEKVPE